MFLVQLQSIQSSHSTKKDTINDILGGIRSTCTYVGAAQLKELSKRTTFMRVTQQINEVYGSRDESKEGPKSAP